MPAYATVADVRVILARDDSDPTGTAATLPDVKITAELVAASAEVDARLAGRYLVPFAAAPPLVATLTRDIAAYRANLLYRQSEDLAADDPMVLRYTAAQLLLEKLASGAADLPGVGTGDGNSTAGVAHVRNQYAGQLFGPDNFGLGYGQRQPRGSYPGGW